MTEPVCKVCGRPFESTDKVREAEGICAGCATPPAEREPFEDNIAIEQRRSDILEEIRAERLRQIGKWGTTKTRDQHWNAADWYEMISDYNAWSRRMWAMGSLHKARRRLIQTAALAVAAVEALDAVHIPHIQQILELVRGLTTPSPCGDYVPCEKCINAEDCEKSELPAAGAMGHGHD